MIDTYRSYDIICIRGVVSNTGHFVCYQITFFIYNEKLMKCYHDLDNNITISSFVIMLYIVENVPGPYCKQWL